MAYDAAKAHEYYLKYRKKGLKKGRKKGTKKASTGTKTSLLGLSSSGLNDNGKIEAGIIKDRYKKAMNEALAKANTPEEKERIRAEYSKKAQAEINALKSDPQYAKAKSQKASGSSKQAKAASSKKAAKESSGSSKSKSASASATKNTAGAKVNQQTINTLKKQMDALRKLMPTATVAQKKQLVVAMTSLLNTLKSLKGVSAKEEKQYKADISGQSKSANR